MSPAMQRTAVSSQPKMWPSAEVYIHLVSFRRCLDKLRRKSHMMRFRNRWMMSEHKRLLQELMTLSCKWDDKVRVTGVCDPPFNPDLHHALHHLFNSCDTDTDGFSLLVYKPGNIFAWCHLVHLNRTWRAGPNHCNPTSWVWEQAAVCLASPLWHQNCLICSCLSVCVSMWV